MIGERIEIWGFTPSLERVWLPQVFCSRHGSMMGPGWLCPLCSPWAYIDEHEGATRDER